ncbi:MAG: methyltransferase [Clostridia bacterium]|nr:methyltransferase [Clostridia bacterium]
METLSHIGSNFTIFQREDSFKFGTDAVLLARFARMRKKDVLYDFCSGTGAVGFFCHLLYQPKEIGFVELDETMCCLSEKTATYNGIKEKCRFFCTDLSEFNREKNLSYADCITVNPPYFLEHSGKTNQNPNLTGARHTDNFSHQVLFQKAYELLKDGGKLFLIQRVQNLAEILYLMRCAHIEPKRLRMVHSYKKKDATLFLVEGVKNGGVWLDCLPPLVLYRDNGEMTEEFKKMQEF